MLSEKARGNQVVLLDTLELGSHKTKDFAGVLAKLGVEGKALILDRKQNVNLSRAAANNPKVVAENARSEKPLSISSTAINKPPKPKPMIMPSTLACEVPTYSGRTWLTA